MSRDRSVGIETGYELICRGSIPSRNKALFSLLHSIQTDPWGLHNPIYIEYRGLGSEPDHSSPSTAEIKNDGTIILLPPYAYFCGLNYLQEINIYAYF
jgi:hypothetical protein